jgi:hypothetical protein
MRSQHANVLQFRVPERHVNAVERHDRDARSVDGLLAI